MSRGASKSGVGASPRAGGDVAAERVDVRGQVQGVGFRPFVFRIATELGLEGSVFNEPAGVVIRLVGEHGAIECFVSRLVAERPPLARIDAITRRSEAVWDTGGAFRIVESAHVGVPNRVTVDSATCPECLAELQDAKDRRHGHALINCTNCGPRYTIVRDVPYDRALTTMAGFAMCPRCATEYRDPHDRRFHAQPTCCPDCGPRVRCVDGGGAELAGDPIAAAASVLRGGGVLAVKGLGGYHLAVDATNAGAVASLRARKRRDHKPFAVLVDSLETARALVELSAEAEALLTSPAAPIVLAARKPNASVAEAVAPGMHRLGLMLPHTPIQHLLVRQGFRTLVMTSANASDDPLVTDDGQAIRVLSAIADAWLMHDRPIERAVDDSVVVDTAVGLVPIRRARGFVPAPIALPGLGSARSTGPGVCVGGELKGAIAIVYDGQAVLSQHLGDLTYTLAFERFKQAIEDLLRLLRVRPEWIACDAHPGYLSRRHARGLAQKLGVPLLEVHHHHAHLASVMAEHGRSERTIGLICDGVGFGADGTSWGGEILVGDLDACQRIGRMRPLKLPGGDAAAKRTTRCALAWLMDARDGQLGEDPACVQVAAELGDRAERAAVEAMLARDLNCPPSSGMGRLFDAAAAVLGVCTFNHFEAMSGMTLEALASGVGPTGEDVCNLMPISVRGGLSELDHRPLARRLAAGMLRGESIARLARLVHEVLACGLVRGAEVARGATGIEVVGLSGGVFCNGLLTSLVQAGLRRSGFEVLVHRDVPPNDGGLALGQAAIAAARRETTGV